jgi:hypothetical protein
MLPGGKTGRWRQDGRVASGFDALTPLVLVVASGEIIETYELP